MIDLENGAKVEMKIEICPQTLFTENDYIVSIPYQTFTLQGVLNFCTEYIGDCFWELILDQLLQINAEEGPVQLRRIVFNLLPQEGRISANDNFFFFGHFILDRNIDDGTESVRMDANVLSIQ
jgi:hypothetical protein